MNWKTSKITLFSSDKKKYYFTQIMIKMGNLLSDNVVKALGINSFTRELKETESWKREVYHEY